MLVLELRFLCWAQVSAYSQCVGGVAAALGIGLQSAPATSRGAQFIATPNTQKFPESGRGPRVVGSYKANRSSTWAV